ncbi:FeoA family protein [Spirochaeta cellobiosiphila]|uniref:FeoA family protein n=1 Tax=Spirochaeta cellobiosiphila TaxID=504483 RepID=UPI0003FB08E2|nr:FeoA family protein [Spirochaeta cellobiosiphila]
MATIQDLHVGDKVVISGYEKDNPTYRQKLLSMGLTRGTEVELTKVAPMGDPVEILVRGFKLSLRKEEAQILKFEEVSHE